MLVILVKLCFKGKSERGVGFEPTPTRVDCNLYALDRSAILTAR